MPKRPAKPEDAFWARVRKTSHCWLWTGPLSDKGYGLLIVQVDGKRTKIRAHRFAYELLREPIPAGLEIDHLCRRRNCVNPAHLEPVTTRVNVLRGVGPTAVAARKDRCLRDHPFDRVVIRSNGRRSRACSICARKRAA